MSRPPTRRAAARRIIAPILAGALGAVAPGAPAQPANATAWPTKPVRFLVAYPAGGLADVMLRQIQAGLADALGQPIVIENKAGANGNLAVEAMRAGPPDGHTFVVTSSGTETLNPLMYAKMSFDPAKDLRPVALLANGMLYLIVRPTLDAADAKALVAHAKANPGKLTYGSAGSGTTPHLTGELLKRAAGIYATHIPYRGAAPAIQDTVAGQIDFMFAPGTAFPLVRAGRLKLLAVASAQRSKSWPSAPTMAEAGYGRQIIGDTLFGVWAPADTPQPVVQRLNAEINRQTTQPAVRTRFAELGADVEPLTPDEFRARIDDEAKRFGEIVRAQRITAE